MTTLKTFATVLTCSTVLMVGCVKKEHEPHNDAANHNTENQQPVNLQPLSPAQSTVADQPMQAQDSPATMPSNIGSTTVSSTDNTQQDAIASAPKHSGQHHQTSRSATTSPSSTTTSSSTSSTIERHAATATTTAISKPKITDTAPETYPVKDADSTTASISINEQSADASPAATEDDAIAAALKAAKPAI